MTDLSYFSPPICILAPVISPIISPLPVEINPRAGDRVGVMRTYDEMHFFLAQRLLKYLKQFYGLRPYYLLDKVSGKTVIIFFTTKFTDFNLTPLNCLANPDTYALMLKFINALNSVDQTGRILKVEHPKHGSGYVYLNHSEDNSVSVERLNQLFTD